MTQPGPRSLAWPIFGAAAVGYAAGVALLATVPMEALGGPAVFWPAVTTTLSFLFSAREVDLATVTTDLVRTTNSALAPASLGIWLRAREARR